MRYIKQGVVRDQAGNIFIGATISVYLAGTTTPASVYAAKTGGVAVNSVLTDTYGNFIYYVDTADYSTSQLFKEVVTFSSKYDTQTVDDIIIFPVGGNGTVTSVSITSANGVSGTVANATTVPAITLTLGAITPTSVNSVVISGSSTPTLAVTGTTAVTGTNTGDETAARIATIVTGAGAQTTPLDADEFPFYKIVGTVLSKVTWANIKTTLGALFAPINNPTFTGTVIAGKVTITPVATGSTLTILDGKTVTANKTMSFTAADDTGVYTLPTGTKTIAATDSNITGTAANVSGTPALPNGTTATTQSAGGNDTKLATTAFVTTAVGAISGGTVATGAELDTGTDNAKFSSAKALKDSHNVPSVVPSTSGNVLTSNGTDWTSAAPPTSATYAIVAGTTYTLASANTERSTQLATPQKKKEIKVNQAGTYTVNFQLKSDAGGALFAYGRVYKNGSILGTEQSSISTSYTNFAQDFTFAANDLVQIYIYSADGVTTALTNDFNIKYAVTITYPYTGTVNTD